MPVVTGQSADLVDADFPGYVVATYVGREDGIAIGSDDVLRMGPVKSNVGTTISFELTTPGLYDFTFYSEDRIGDGRLVKHIGRYNVTGNVSLKAILQAQPIGPLPDPTDADVIDGLAAAAVSDTGSQTYAALGPAIEARAVEAIADSDTVEAAIAQAAPAAVQAALYTTRTAKNLYNPADPDVMTDKVPAVSAGQGGPGAYLALANYRVSGFIPVTVGQPVTVSQFRYWEWYDASKTSLGLAGNTGSNAAVQTLSPPTNAAYLRVTHHYVNNPNMQVERGSVATTFEPYFTGTIVDIDPTFAFLVGSAARVGPLSITKTGQQITVTRDLAGSALAQTMTLAGADNNQSFNLIATTLAGTQIHDLGDDITPLRTQFGPVGANHSYNVVRSFANPDGKTTADVGSVWTDGARQHVLLSIDTTGRPVFGGSYTTDGSGVVTSATVAPVANLTHVSGAVHTAAVDRTTIAATQLFPVGQFRKVVTARVDDASLTADGTRSGRSLVISETYEIPDYASIYDTSKANVGTPLTSLNLAPAVRVSNTWTWTAVGCLLQTELVELKPTRLGQCGSIQTNIMTKSGATVTRYLPGVGVASGFDFTAGVDMTNWSTSVNITTADLKVPTRPPSVSLDVLATSGTVEVGFVCGYLPAGRRGDEASRDTDRLTKAPTKLWDLRNTKKNYPTWTTDEPAGWGVKRTAAFRAYLTPTQVATVLAAKGDALSASAVAQALLSLP